MGLRFGSVGAWAVFFGRRRGRRSDLHRTTSDDQEQGAALGQRVVGRRAALAQLAVGQFSRKAPNSDSRKEAVGQILLRLFFPEAIFYRKFSPSFFYSN
jgi:hypothetical protein